MKCLSKASNCLLVSSIQLQQTLTLTCYFSLTPVKHQGRHSSMKVVHTSPHFVRRWCCIALYHGAPNISPMKNKLLALYFVIYFQINVLFYYTPTNKLCWSLLLLYSFHFQNKCKSYTWSLFWVDVQIIHTQHCPLSPVCPQCHVWAQSPLHAL